MSHTEAPSWRPRAGRRGHGAVKLIWRRPAAAAFRPAARAVCRLSRRTQAGMRVTLPLAVVATGGDSAAVPRPAAGGPLASESPGPLDEPGRVPGPLGAAVNPSRQRRSLPKATGTFVTRQPESSVVPSACPNEVIQGSSCTAGRSLSACRCPVPSMAAHLEVLT